jgi:hypothetical protein
MIEIPYFLWEIFKYWFVLCDELLEYVVFCSWSAFGRCYSGLVLHSFYLTTNLSTCSTHISFLTPQICCTNLPEISWDKIRILKLHSFLGRLEYVFLCACVSMLNQLGRIDARDCNASLTWPLSPLARERRGQSATHHNWTFDFMTSTNSSSWLVVVRTLAWPRGTTLKVTWNLPKFCYLFNSLSITSH